MRWYDGVIGRFAGVDPIAERFAWVSPYNYAENSPIGNIDLWGLQAVSVSDADGNERFSGDYDDSSIPNDIKGAVDAISTKDNACIQEICFTDVGPQEFSQKTWWVPKKAVFHELSYTYTGTGEDGNDIEGTGSLLIPVTTYKTGSSLGDVVLGALLSKGFQLIGNSFVRGNVQVASVVAEAANAMENWTTVGRWMSKIEYNAMKSGGNVLEGAGGQTFVTKGGPTVFQGAPKGSIYVEFQVPTNSLLQGGKDGWFKILGPNATKSQLYLLEKQGGQLLPPYRNLSSILMTK